MYNRILVPLDGSELAECVLPHVEAIAKGCGVNEIVALIAIEPVYLFADEGGGTATVDVVKLQNMREESAASYLKEVAGKLQARNMNVRTAMLKGNAADVIVDFARNNGVDLIAMATHGRSGISRWVWGSTAEKILRSATVPVLMVRPDGCKV